MQRQRRSEVYHPAEHIPADRQRVILPVHDGIGERCVDLGRQRLGLRQCQYTARGGQLVPNSPSRCLR